MSFSGIPWAILMYFDPLQVVAGQKREGRDGVIQYSTTGHSHRRVPHDNEGTLSKRPETGTSQLLAALVVSVSALNQRHGRTLTQYLRGHLAAQRCTMQCTPELARPMASVDLVALVDVEYIQFYLRWPARCISPFQCCVVGGTK